MCDNLCDNCGHVPMVLYHQSSSPSRTLSTTAEHLGLDRALQLLSDVSAAETGDKLLKVNQAMQIVDNARRQLGITPLKQLEEMVENRDWEKATEALENNFRDADKADTVKQILELVYEKVEGMHCTIGWLKHLGPELQPAACQTLYDLMRSNGDTNKPKLLLLLQIVQNLPGNKLIGERAHMENECRQIVERIAEIIVTLNFNDDTLVEIRCPDVLKLLLPLVVRKFDVSSNYGVQLLINFHHQKLPFHSAFSNLLISTLLQTLEENLLLGSEQALHVWAYVTSIGQQPQDEWLDDCVPGGQSNDSHHDILIRMKSRLFVRYQLYIEDQDKKKIKKLHEQSPYMWSLMNEFIPWYYKGDPKKLKHLLEVVKCFEGCSADVVMLRQVHQEMIRWHQIHTFSAFCVYVELKRIVMSDWGIKPFDSELFCVKLQKVEVPDCARLLLLSSFTDNQQLRLVNKSCKMPLCVQQDKVVCCKSENQDELFIATVDPDTALTSFKFQSWQLDASDGEVTKVAEVGTQWKITAVDKHHVKIFTENGQFLTAGAPFEDDGQMCRVVSMMKENGWKDQHWKVELPVAVAVKKIYC